MFCLLSERRESIVLAFGIVVINTGAVLANKPYLSLWYGDLPSAHITVAPNQPDLYPLRRGLMPGFSIVGRDGIDLAPNEVDQLCDIVITVSLAYDRQIFLKGTIEAEHAPPQHFSATVTVELLAAAIARATNNEMLRSSDFMVFEPAIH
ncbi:MAG: hypothetical protein ABIQ70_03225 [Dokdonella sp.]